MQAESINTFFYVGGRGIASILYGTQIEVYIDTFYILFKRIQAILCIACEQAESILYIAHNIEVVHCRIVTLNVHYIMLLCLS